MRGNGEKWEENGEKMGGNGGKIGENLGGKWGGNEEKLCWFGGFWGWFLGIFGVPTPSETLVLGSHRGKAQVGIWDLSLRKIRSYEGILVHFWDFTGLEVLGGTFGGFLGSRPPQKLRFWGSHRGKAWSDDTAPLGPDRHARDVSALDKYAEERWEVRF